MTSPRSISWELVCLLWGALQRRQHPTSHDSSWTYLRAHTIIILEATLLLQSSDGEYLPPFPDNCYSSYEVWKTWSIHKRKKIVSKMLWLVKLVIFHEDRVALGYVPLTWPFYDNYTWMRHICPSISTLTNKVCKKKSKIVRKWKQKRLYRYVLFSPLKPLLWA